MADEVLISGKELLEAHFADIKRIVGKVCADHHFRPQDIEDFEQHVYEKLIEDDYSRLRRWQRKSRLTTFLYAVIERLMLDYLIRLWGKWRPSREAQRKGEVAILLERFMQRDGYTFDEACELLWTNRQVTLSRDELRRLADRQPIRSSRRFESDDALANVPASSPSPDHEVVECERERYFAALRAALREIVKPMPPRDRYVLVLRFWDDHSVADIARMLKLDAKKLHPHLARLLKTLRSELEARGFDSESVPEI